MLAFKMYNILQQQQQKQELRKHLILFYQKTTPANEWQQRHLYYRTLTIEIMYLRGDFIYVLMLGQQYGNPFQSQSCPTNV